VQPIAAERRQLLLFLPLPLLLMTDYNTQPPTKHHPLIFPIPDKPKKNEGSRKMKRWALGGQQSGTQEVASMERGKYSY